MVLTSIAMIALCGVGIYTIFFGLGIVYAIIFSTSECQKQNVQSALVEASWWGMYPVIAWVFISIPYIRIQFDKFFMMFGLTKESAVWVSFGYALMLAALAGIFSLRSAATTASCVPTVDEADAFRKRMLALQRQKDLDLEAAREAASPAVVAI